MPRSAGPTQVLVHFRQDLGKRGQALNAWIPILSIGPGCDLLCGRIALRPPPLIGLRHLLRVSRCSQYFRYQRVRIERDGRYQLLQLLRAQRLHLRLGLSITLLRVGLFSVRLLLWVLLLLSRIGLLLRIRLLLLVVGLLLRIRRLLLIVGLLLLLRIRLLRRIVRLLPVAGC